MPHYSIKDKSGKLLAICESPNIVTAKAGAANLLLNVQMAAPGDLFEAGRSGIDSLKFFPKKRSAGVAVDPAQTDLEDQIRAAEGQADAEAAARDEAAFEAGAASEEEGI